MAGWGRLEGVVSDGPRSSARQAEAKASLTSELRSVTFQLLKIFQCDVPIAAVTNVQFFNLAFTDRTSCHAR